MKTACTMRCVAGIIVQDKDNIFCDGELFLLPTVAFLCFTGPSEASEARIAITCPTTSNLIQAIGFKDCRRAIK